MSEEQLRESTDAVLVSRMQSLGDSRAMVELYHRHRGTVLAACLRVLQDRSAAEDLTQETFLRMYTHIGDYHEGNFVGWLHTIARHLCLNHLQRSSNRNEVLGLEAHLMEIPLGRPGPGQQGDPELLAQVLECLQELSDDQRVVLKLLYMEEYTYKEVAEKTRFTEDRVRSAAQNGRRMFAKAWKRRFGNGDGGG